MSIATLRSLPLGNYNADIYQQMFITNDSFLAIELSAITLTYGGVLAIIAASLAGQWSGQASLITFYLILVAPLVMGVIAYRNRTFRIGISYRKWIFYAGVLYFIIAPVTGLLLVFFE